MNIPKEIRASFYDESLELFEQWENAMLALEENPLNEEEINAAFRAIHTLKGNSGVLGFTLIADQCHVVETVFDQVRSKTLELNDDLVALFLQFGDKVKQLNEAAINAGEGNEADIEAVYPQETIDELKQLTKSIETQLNQQNKPGNAKPEEATQAATAEGNVESDKDSELAVLDDWYISLRLGVDVYRMGVNPIIFMHDLETVGDILEVRTVTDHVSASAEYNPEECHLWFEIHLCSSAGREDILETFAVIGYECDIKVINVSKELAEANKFAEENKELSLLNKLIADQQSNEAESTAVVESEQVAPQKAEEIQAAVSSKPVKSESSDVSLTKPKQSLKVDADKLDALINLVGEMVIATSRAEMVAHNSQNLDLIEAISSLGHLVEGIRDSSLQMRMIQVGETFNRFKRIVRDVSRETDKDVELFVNGSETELDKSVIEKISDPLVHLVRNAIDHGLESREERIAAGKPEKGRVLLNAFHDSGSIVIEVQDDGKGLDRDRILAKAVERDLLKPNSTLSEEDVYRLIFAAGFSTADKVTSLSGRGVGMDVVKKNIESLRGRIDVASQPGKGTSFFIRLPLTLAIIDGFRIRVGDSCYIVPLNMVKECIELHSETVEHEDSDYINLRGKLLPYIRLRELFQHNDGSSGAMSSKGDVVEENIVVVEFGGQLAGLAVDELLGEYQTVIKPLNKVFQNLKGFSGATILGSGEVALILDVATLISEVVKRDRLAKSGRYQPGQTPQSGLNLQ